MIDIASLLSLTISIIAALSIFSLTQKTDFEPGLVSFGLPAIDPLFPGTPAGSIPTAAQIASWVNARYVSVGYTDPGFVPGENFPAFIEDDTTTPKKVRKINLSDGDYIALLPYSSGVVVNDVVVVKSAAAQYQQRRTSYSGEI